jgi:malonyl-ACP O-methyltransferase BioC
MDKQLIAERFAKAAATYEREATVQMQIARHMAELLQRYTPATHSRILEIGCGTGSYSRMLLERYKPASLIINDICREMLGQCSDLSSRGVEFLPGDAEQISFPTGQDLITSCSALQWFERPADFFNKCSSCLTAEGHLAFSTFGSDNMKQVTQLTGDGLSYPSADELKQMLSRHYTIVYAEEETIEQHFATPKDVLRHLKETGVTGIRSRHWTPRQLMEFCNRYTEMFGSGHDVALTYHPIYIIAKKIQQ